MADAEIKTKIKARKALRGWCTRKSNSLDTVIKSTPPASIAVLEDAIREFDLQLAQLDAVQEEIQVLFIDEDAMLADLEESADFRDNVRKNRVLGVEKLNILLAAAQPLPATPAASSNGDISTALAEVKLPKLELTKYRGDVLEYESWWDVFLLIHESTTIPTISKFVYLKSCLEGEAAQAIAGLKVSEANYGTAIDIITNRFGGKDKRIFSHMTQLIGLSCTKPNVECLRGLRDQLLSHTRSLENLEITKEQYGVFLTPLVISKLPTEVRMEWSRDSEGRQRDIEYLLTFLESEIKRRDRSLTVSGPQQPQQVQTPRNSTAAALVSGATAAGCEYCHKNHPTDRCFKLTKISHSERHELIKKARLCFRCLSANHSARGCFAKCSGCRGNHHLLLCSGRGGGHGNQKSQSVESAKPAVNVDVDNSSQETNAMNVSGVNPNVKKEKGMISINQKLTVLQSAPVVARGRSGSTEVNLVLDTGSDRSFGTSSIIHKTNMEFIRSEYVSTIPFGSEEPSGSLLRHIYNGSLVGKDGLDRSVNLTEVKTICAPLSQSYIPPEVLEFFGDLDWCQGYQTASDVKIDILIGMDCYWRFVKHKIIPGPYEELVAQDTVFGFMLSGNTDPESRAGPSVNSQLLCISKEEVESFWSLETVGISTEEDEVHPQVASLQASLVKSDGRYELPLPWKPGKREQLRNNENMVKKRQLSMSKRVSPDVKRQVDDIFRGYEETGVIEEVIDVETPRNPVYYMPHRAVLKPEAVSTKVRPVFNASAKSYNGLSLNDCMETGPNLLANLTEVLIRFRRYKIALVADIEKAFYQISVALEDRDVHRFFWELEGKLRVMRFCRLPFGNTASPFLLIGTLQQHVKALPVTHATQELVQNMYMDNLLTGADTASEVIELIRESSSIMEQAGMNLRQFASNDTDVGSLLAVEFSDKSLSDDQIPMLGMKWLTESDVFSYKGPLVDTDLVITKRVILSLFSKLFDPLGFAAPYVLVAKLLFQDLWSKGLRWNDEVDPDCRLTFLRWLDDLEVLRSWEIPRCYTPDGWSCIKNISLHVFGDASPKAYGACVYLVCEMPDSSKVVSLVIAKSRLAPLKSRSTSSTLAGGLTVPRLELMAGLLTSRLLVFARNALNLPDRTEFTCYSDSKIALAWIQGDLRRWQPFVANRVKDILKAAPASRWKYCPTDMNPADLLTRGVSADELVNSKSWINGPDFLLDANLDESPEYFDTTEEARHIPHTLAVFTSQEKTAIFDIERWGSFSKAIRVVTWVNRFMHKFMLKHGEKFYPKFLDSIPDMPADELSFDELQRAKLDLFRDVQRKVYSQETTALKEGKSQPSSSTLSKFSIFLDEDGLLRLKGRIQFSNLSYGEKHPLIIPKGHLTLLLVRFYHIKLQHAGVATMLTSLRNEYWLVGGRLIAKQVKKACIPCQRHDSRPCYQPMPPLPMERVTQAIPFAVTGIDHAGPLFCVEDPRKKYYVLLCTCAVTRAVHLELVEALSTAATILALRRLAARRGMPRLYLSDNAQGFKGCREALVGLFAALAPDWDFIPPRSPWFGGWWERLVGSMKLALKKTVGLRSLTAVELLTVLQEVEACINSRPLTFLSDDSDGIEPLTPAHFILGHNQGFFPRATDTQPVRSAADLETMAEARKTMVDRFWKVWSTEYIRSLPPLSGPTGKSKLCVGSMVLLRDLTPRLKWPLGRITEVFPSKKDGVIRTVIVETKNGPLTRSVPRLHDLEFMCDVPDEPQSLPVPNPDGTLPLPATDSVAAPLSAAREPAAEGADSAQSVNATAALDQFGVTQNAAAAQNDASAQNDAKAQNDVSDQAKAQNDVPAQNAAHAQNDATTQNDASIFSARRSSRVRKTTKRLINEKD